MSERIFPPLSSVNSPSGVQPGIPINRQPVPDSAGGGFKQILNEKLLPELKISAHAQKRMQDRGITLSPTELAGIKEAVGKAQAKGCRFPEYWTGWLSSSAWKIKLVVTAVDDKV